MTTSAIVLESVRSQLLLVGVLLEQRFADAVCCDCHCNYNCSTCTVHFHAAIIAAACFAASACLLLCRCDAGQTPGPTGTAGRLIVLISSARHRADSWSDRNGRAERLPRCCFGSRRPQPSELSSQQRSGTVRGSVQRTPLCNSRYAPTQGPHSQRTPSRMA